jgi:biotin carboxyl carrier protein
VIDLDILACDDLHIDEPDLQVPHPRLRARAFALVPLAEIDAAFRMDLQMLPREERDAIQRIPAAPARTKRPVDWDQTLERARSAAEFCASAGLTRFRIDEDDLAIEVRRSLRHVRPVAPAVPGEGGTANGVHPASNGATPVSEKPKTTLKAEFVGIVRLSRPTVVQGSIVSEDRELAYVEALGIRNPVRSGGSGRVAEVFVSDGQAVEYGQPLFSIEV